MGGASLGKKKERKRKSERVGFDQLTWNSVPSVIQKYCYLRLLSQKLSESWRWSFVIKLVLYLWLYFITTALCGGMKSPYLPCTPLRGCCTPASAEAQASSHFCLSPVPWGRVQLRPLHPLLMQFYICDVSGDTWPCTVLDGKHSTISK